jgi:hypothetical protein
VIELSLRAREVLTSIEERGEFGTAMLIANERVGLYYGFEPPYGRHQPGP